MTEILITVAVFGICMAGGCVGYLLTGRELRGSCGGVRIEDGKIVGDCACARERSRSCSESDEVVEAAVARGTSKEKGESKRGEVVALK